jgi:hypothetical protein
MDVNFDFQPMYPRHDLMVELGEVKMAIDSQGESDESGHSDTQPSLESRMHSLLDALDHLAI